MYFPTAGIEISPWIPPLVAFVISFFTSTGGLSGAFLILPFQVSVLGFTSPAVSATNHLYNIVAIPSGVYRYVKEGRMVWPLTWVVILGTLPGVFIGAILRVEYLPDPLSFKFFAGLVLLYMGLRLLNELVRRKPAGKNQNSAELEFQKHMQELRKLNGSGAGLDEKPLPRVVVKKFSLSRIVYEFYGQTFDINAVLITSVSFLVGIAGGIYGIGGGAIIAPFFVSFFHLPVYTVAGAALMGTFTTSVAGVLFYQLLALWYPGMAIAPDWALGVLFGLGGFAGIYCGARLQKHVPAKAIKWILVVCILYPAIKYIWEFFR